ncbi:MAG: hypothetical protein ACLUN5_19045 [Oscillospiraceae bacterium]
MTQNLGEKIRQARREKGMTQEQLAQALFVSRRDGFQLGKRANRTGLSDPDAAFGTGGAGILAQEETQTEPEAEEEDRAQKPDEKKKFRLRPWLMILAAAALFVLGIIFLPSVGHEKGGYTIDWFEQETANEPGQAYIRIYTKTELPVAGQTADGGIHAGLGI